MKAFIDQAIVQMEANGYQVFIPECGDGAPDLSLVLKTHLLMPNCLDTCQKQNRPPQPPTPPARAVCT